MKFSGYCRHCANKLKPFPICLSYKKSFIATLTNHLKGGSGCNVLDFIIEVNNFDSYGLWTSGQWQDRRVLEIIYFAWGFQLKSSQNIKMFIEIFFPKITGVRDDEKTFILLTPSDTRNVDA